MSRKEKHNEDKTFLESLNPPSGMKVPAGYFDDFEKEMLARIKEETKSEESLVIPIHKKSNTVRILTWLSVAASIMVAVFLYTNSTTKIDTEQQFSEETTDWDYYEVDEYLLAENFTEEELEAVSVSDEFLSDEEIYDYILQENYSEFTLSENL
jgi:hypothetical protein